MCSEKVARALFKPCGHMVACESEYYFIIIIIFSYIGMLMSLLVVKA